MSSLPDLIILTVQFSGFLIFSEVTGPTSLEDAERTCAKTENPNDSRNPKDTQGVNYLAEDIY